MQTEKKLVCKECQKQGLKSKVYPDRTPYAVNLFHHVPNDYYDEYGKYHPNTNKPIIMEYFKCSNGHTFCEDVS